MYQVMKYINQYVLIKRIKSPVELKVLSLHECSSLGT